MLILFCKYLGVKKLESFTLVSYIPEISWLKSDGQIKMLITFELIASRNRYWNCSSQRVYMNPRGVHSMKILKATQRIINFLPALWIL